MSRPWIPLVAFALLLPLAAAGCGGDDGGDGDPREVLERAFNNDDGAASGVIDVALDVTGTGDEGGGFSAEVSGPFERDPDDPAALPQADIELSASGSGGGEDLDESARVVITDENAFVEYGGETYEAGEMFSDLEQGFELGGEEVDEDASFREGCEQALSQLGGDTAACDIDVAGEWLTNLEDEGTEDVEGAETTHISGDLDVEQVVADLEALLGSVSETSLGSFDASQIAEAVPEASFGAFVGTEDDHIRRVELAMTIEPSALLGSLVAVPVDQLTVDFSTTISEVDEPQTIEAPGGPTSPLTDLFDELGLGGLSFGGLPGGGGLPDFDDQPGDSGGGPGDSGGGPGDDSDGGPDDGGGVGEAEIDPEQAQQYLECLQQAEGDAEAINACAEELE